MTKDEYVQSLEKWKDIITQIDDDYGSGYSTTLQDALSVAEKLDEPKKVVIPQFVDDWFENLKKYYGDKAEPLRLVMGIGHYIGTEDPHYEWLKNKQNQKLLLKAIVNGYEVEKQKKYRVRVKGISTNHTNLLRYHTSLKTFELAGVSTNAKNFKTEFTKQWLKNNWVGFNTYNNAGLLEFEEVEDD